jgi:hypothetical protein
LHVGTAGGNKFGTQTVGFEQPKRKGMVQGKKLEELSFVDRHSWAVRVLYHGMGFAGDANIEAEKSGEDVGGIARVGGGKVSQKKKKKKKKRQPAPRPVFRLYVFTVECAGAQPGEPMWKYNAVAIVSAGNMQ